jgi:hypothetical protein
MDFPTLAELPTLDYTAIQETAIQKTRPGDYIIDYDRDLDTLFIYWKAKPDLAAHRYLKDGVYALYDPATLRVLGFQIEEFERLFIVRYAIIGDAWRKTSLFWRTRTRKELIQALLKTIAGFFPSQGDKSMQSCPVPA